MLCGRRSGLFVASICKPSNTQSPPTDKMVDLIRHAELNKTSINMSIPEVNYCLLSIYRRQSWILLTGERNQLSLPLIERGP